MVLLRRLSRCCPWCSQGLCVLETETDSVFLILFILLYLLLAGDIKIHNKETRHNPAFWGWETTEETKGNPGTLHGERELIPNCLPNWLIAAV